jgi:hypothetical protein
MNVVSADIERQDLPTAMGASVSNRSVHGLASRDGVKQKWRILHGSFTAPQETVIAVEERFAGFPINAINGTTLIAVKPRAIGPERQEVDVFVHGRECNRRLHGPWRPLA